MLNKCISLQMADCKLIDQYFLYLLSLEVRRNHATAAYGTRIDSNSETALYIGSTAYNKPRYNDGSTTNDILTEKHAIQTPDGKVINLPNGSSLDSLIKTNLNDVYGFSGAPTASKWWFVDTKTNNNN